MISENYGVLVKLLLTLEGILHSSKQCSNAEMFVMHADGRGGGAVFYWSVSELLTGDNQYYNWICILH